MSFDSKNAADILAESLAIAAYVAIPCLTSLSYLGWKKLMRESLPRWRSVLGVGSMAMTNLVWLGTGYLAFRLYASLNTNFFTGVWVVANIFVTTLAAVCSLALRGRPRILALVAASLMATPWILDYVVGWLNRA